ncbi:Dps family protein [Bradyrhizobium lablabi]|uniref:Dps family protein n=1 Tax=Bradyrhizobium lablabi TaxID=722472 RepID=UPI001BA6DB4C|nr:ferritin-like domain-containing protein [Bradyrhizobium lablabi]MBR0695265.1 DNA starvation/stationary phase protection protein [Bradyrhizobium lablabi]
MNKAIDFAADFDALSSMSTAGVNAVSAAINGLLADNFALFLKTRNFHGHMSGRHFRDRHLLLDEQADAILATTDRLAERVREISGVTIRSVGQIARLRTITDTDESYDAPRAMPRELMNAGRCCHAEGARIVRRIRGRGDNESLLDNFINEAERSSGLSSKHPVKQETTLKEHAITGSCRPCRNISSI